MADGGTAGELNAAAGTIAAKCRQLPWQRPRASASANRCSGRATQGEEKEAKLVMLIDSGVDSAEFIHTASLKVNQITNCQCNKFRSVSFTSSSPSHHPTHSWQGCSVHFLFLQPGNQFVPLIPELSFPDLNWGRFIWFNYHLVLKLLECIR